MTERMFEADETVEILAGSGRRVRVGTKPAFLIVFRGGSIGATYRLKTHALLGRASEAHVRLTGEGISRLHAEITRTADGDCIIADLQSRNGTWVNGERVRETLLRDGDRLQLGDAELKFSYEDELEQQVRQSQKMSALGALAAGLAHDFNNLLAVVLGGTTQLRLELNNGPITQDAAPILDDVQQAAKSLAGLARQLSILARSGEFELAAVDVPRVVNDMLQLLRATLDRRIMVEQEWETGLPLRVLADASQLQQLLLNLCINARDAMPHGGELVIGGRRVELSRDRVSSLSSALEPGPYVEMFVRDSGHGMDDNALRHLFEPSFSTKGTTGLGLAIVYSIGQRHRGHVTVQSETGKGTEFRVYLPVHEPPGEGAAVSLAQPEEAPVPPNLLADCTILVVEDDARLRRTLIRLLKRLQCTVLEAENGSKCMDVYEAQRSKIGLVILDMMMPVVDGREAFERLRICDPNLPILICSGYDAGRVDSLLQHAHTGFLAKPFSLDALNGAVGRIVRESKLRAPANPA